MLGFAIVEFTGHQNPAWQRPVIAEAPDVEQYEPAGQSVQLANDVPPVADRYVPAGHGIGEELPAGQ